MLLMFRLENNLQEYQVDTWPQNINMKSKMAKAHTQTVKKVMKSFEEFHLGINVYQILAATL